MTNTKTLNKVLSWTSVICAVTLFAMIFWGNYNGLMFHAHGPNTDNTYGICWNYTAIILVIEIVGLAAVIWKLIFCSIPNFKKLGAEPNTIAGLVLDAVLICSFALLIMVIPLMGGTKTNATDRHEIIDMVGWFANPLALITSIAGLKIGKGAYKK